MDIPAVAKWYDDVDRHGTHCSGKHACVRCRVLMERIAALRVKYADRLVTV